MQRAVASITASLLAAACLPAIAAEPARLVLVLYSNGRSLPANVEADRGLRETIPSTANPPVEFSEEFLDVPRFGQEAHGPLMESFLRHKYASRPPVLIVAAGKEALVFLLRHRTDLYPQVPVIHMGAPASFLRSIPPLPADVVGVPFEYEFGRTIDLALRWHPRARRLVLVTGAAVPDREWEALLRSEVPRFKDRATVEFLAALPTGEVLKRLSGLGDDAVVFTPGYFEDGAGRNFQPRQSVMAMVAVSSAPVYGPFGTYMGTGVVGGYMQGFKAMGRQAGRTVIDLLHGVAPSSLRLPEISPTTLNVDWQQVLRFKIDERAIPRDAVVHFKPPTLLEAYRNAVLVVVVVCLLQAGMLLRILVERRRRRRAEVAEQVHRFELAHASRLTVAGELMASIAHEINQPLGAILANADAADFILESGSNRRDEMRAILADIRRDDLRASEVIRRLRAMVAKRDIEKMPLDLNEAMTDVELMVRAEARRRQVTLEIRPATTAVKIKGDRIEILQVLINLVLNAMDSVAALPEDRRKVIVSVAKAASGIGIEVRDRGHGIAPENMPKLFDSFFTTKRDGMGMGLSIARTLVEAHDGRIWAESVPGEGSVFHVDLPVADGMGAGAPGQA